MTGIADNIEWRPNAKTESNSVIRMGIWSVGVGFVAFLLWALFFPLASAVITPGTFVSEGRNKDIQHADGGSVREIFVVEGQKVVEGQAILELDTAKAQAQLTQLQARYASLSALKERLDAERSNGLRTMAPTKLKFNANILRGAIGGNGVDVNLITNSVAGGETGSPAVGDELKESQHQAYVAGQAVLSAEMQAYGKKIKALEKQRDGVVARMEAQRSLLKMTQDELDRLRPLAERGYIARSRLAEKQRSVLELKSSLQTLAFDKVGLETQVEEVRVMMGKLRAENSSAASKEYSKILGEIAEISDQLVASRAAVDGSIVRASATGILTRLNVTTVGGVVGAGDKIGEIVPHGAELVVQARVLPSDIDYVQIGHLADITVTAFNRRIDDQLRGRVIYKAADAQRDEKTGDPYFTVRLEIAGLKGFGQSRLGDVQAGMQSEVYIHTGSRTFMAYMTNPIVDSFRRAFREQ